jgi:hypothetical protein
MQPLISADQRSSSQRWTNTFEERARRSGADFAAVTANSASTACWHDRSRPGAAAAAAGVPAGPAGVDDLGAPPPQAESAIHAIRHDPAFVSTTQHRTFPGLPAGRARSILAA